MIPDENRLAPVRFRIKYNFLFSVTLLAIGIAFVADYVDAFYGTGWDPLQMRELQNDVTSRVIVFVLLTAAFVIGIWKAFSASRARRDLRAWLGK